MTPAEDHRPQHTSQAIHHPRFVLPSRLAFDFGSPYGTKKSPAPGSAGYRSHHSNLSGTGIPYHGNSYSGLRRPLRTAPPLHQKISTRFLMGPVRRKTSEIRPTPTAFSRTAPQERAIGQDPDNIINLTQGGSDVEIFDTPNEDSPSMKIPDGLRSSPTNLATPAPPPAERTSSETSIHGFSMGSTILGPTLNLAKEPHDKPRTFVRYTLDFEAGLANISAHGFVDLISMGPRW